MKKVVTYYAEDGKPFSNESDCIKYEKQIKREKLEKVQKAMVRLDNKIWKHYNPDSTAEELTEDKLCIAYRWLQNDIIYILSDEKVEDYKSTFNEIKDLIRADDLVDEYASEIIKEYLKDESILLPVIIKRDFATALKEEKDMSEIASTLSYSFSSQDLKNLALLHKKNRFRKKIENLLTACNYHYECGKFYNHEYNEFLKEVAV